MLRFLFEIGAEKRAILYRAILGILPTLATLFGVTENVLYAWLTLATTVYGLALAVYNTPTPTGAKRKKQEEN